MKASFALFAALGLSIASGPASAQSPYDPATRIAAQREAMKPLAHIAGRWRGNAWTLRPSGKHEIVQTERIGPFLDGSVIVIEGRGYEPDGQVGFNALGVIAYDPVTKAYSIQSNAMGFSGVFPLRLTADGYIWEVPAGPGAITRYTAVIRDGAWREIGERIAGDAPPVQTFEMNLKRIGDGDWPGAGAVPMK
jgi:hypothetical protein